MRLLNTSTLELESFQGDCKPYYAILSHTWESEGELLFEDLMHMPKKEYTSKSGYRKMRNTCNRALRDGYTYVWIDTCCIDKSSSAELSEAINSMFDWYEDSRICYAFLSDVANSRAKFHASRWFRRGWTLQELIAPDKVMFLDADWQDLGSREDLVDEIYAATNIERAMLIRSGVSASWALRNFSIAQRMRWASKRNTSRLEDMSYCLMGLFDINMPLLYGEGPKAFRRLQEAIIGESADHSILAFRCPSARLGSFYESSSILAPWIDEFLDDIRPEWSQSTEPPRLENGNVVLMAYLCTFTAADRRSLELLASSKGEFEFYAPTHFALLDCVFEDDYLSRPALLLRQVKPGRFVRCSEGLLKVTIITGHGQQANFLGDEVSLKLSLDQSMEKSSIIIEKERCHVTRDTPQLQPGPTTLDLSGLKQYCEIGPSHPVLRDGSFDLTVHRFIGVVTLKFKGKMFLVFWGNNSRTEGCIRSLESLRSVSPFAVGADLSEEDAAEAIVREVRKYEWRPCDLVPKLGAIPSKWGRDMRNGAPQYVLGLEDGRLEVRREYITTKFMGRKVRRLKLMGRMLVTQ